MTGLVIGCPVYKRDWIIVEWYQFAVAAAEQAGLDPLFVLVGDDLTDASTFEALRGVMRHELVVVVEPEDPVNDAIHERRTDAYWNPRRYERMAYLRNRLLQTVREVRPEYFLSLDSDILLHQRALGSMIEQAGQWQAVGSKTYMDDSRLYPSYAMLRAPGRGLQRVDSSGVFRVDVIMAIKLMTSQAYAVDYEPHWQGEDVGWCIAARRAGVTLGWDGQFCSKHVTRSSRLRQVDVRCGY